MAFADQMAAELGIPVTPVAEAPLAGAGADVVYLATNSGGKVVADLDVLGDVPLVLSIGSTMPDQRELHAEVLAKADVVVIDTVDVLDALAGGFDQSRARLLGSYLDDAGTPVGTTVYKSIGSPEQDIVLAWEIVSLLQDQEHPGRVIDSLTDIKRNL